MTDMARITVDEALKRGYVWIRMGWNHRLNQPIHAGIRIMRPFLWNGISVAELDEAQAYMNPPEPEPAGDIPMVMSEAPEAKRAD